MEEEEKKDLVEDVKPEEQVVPVENQVVEEFKQESAHDVEVQDDVKEEKKVEETVVKETAITRENIISRLQEMVSDITLAKRPELESLKQSFYKLQRAAQEEQVAVFVAGGGTVEDFKPEPDPVEEQYRKLKP